MTALLVETSQHPTLKRQALETQLTEEGLSIRRHSQE
jgi:hypothetical protein